MSAERMMETDKFSVKDDEEEAAMQTDEQQPLDLSVRKNRVEPAASSTVAKRVKSQEAEPDAKRAKKSVKQSPSSEDLLQAAFRSTVVVRSPASTTTPRTAASSALHIDGNRATATAEPPVAADQRPAVVETVGNAMPTPRPPGLIAAGTGSAFAAYYPPSAYATAEYDRLFFGTNRTPLSLPSSFHTRPPQPPPTVHFRVPPQDQLEHLRQQQQQTLREHVHAINILQEQLQQQQFQQQQLPAAYGNLHHYHHHHRLPYDLSAMMLAQQMNAGPLYDKSPSSPPLPPSSSSNESNPFPCGTAYDCLPKTEAYAYRYPYLSGIFDADFGIDGFGDGGGGGGMGGPGCDSVMSGYSGGRSDCLSPESTTTAADLHHAMHYRRTLRQQHSIDAFHRHVMHKIRSSGTDGVPPDPDAVDPDEIAAIYRQSDFVSFRQRYMDSLGPPRNFEKMRRSIPNKKHGGHGQQQYDQTYVVKRQKNNEAAKKSRDAKRQKYIENQISVMYLTKKVSEMKEIKRRLLLAM